MKNTCIFLLLFIPLFVFCSDPLALTVADAVQRCLSANQDLILAGKAAKAALRELEYSWNMFLPSINSSIGLSGSDSLFLPSSDSNESDDDPWNLSASVSLQLPLHISSAKEIKQKRLDLQVALSNLKLSEKIIELNKRNYTKIMESYEPGESTLLEVEDAQQSLLSSQLSQLNTEYQYLSTLIDLGFALNTDWQQL